MPVGGWKDAHYAMQSARLALSGEELTLYIERLDGAGEIEANQVTLPSANFRFNSSLDNSLFLLQKQNGANWDMVSSWERVWFSEYYKYWISEDSENPNNWGLIQQRYKGGLQVGNEDEIFRYEPDMPDMPDIPDYSFGAAEMGSQNQNVGIGLQKDGEVISKFDYHLSVATTGEGISFWRRVNDQLSEIMTSTNIGYQFEISAGKLKITRRGDGAVVFEDCCSDGSNSDGSDIIEEIIEELLEELIENAIKDSFGKTVGEAIGKAAMTGLGAGAVATVAGAALAAPGVAAVATVAGGGLLLSVAAGALAGAVTGGLVNWFTIPREVLQEAVGSDDSGGGGGGGGGGGEFELTNQNVKDMLTAGCYSILQWLSSNSIIPTPIPTPDFYDLIRLKPVTGWGNFGIQQVALSTWASAQVFTWQPAYDAAEWLYCNWNGLTADWFFDFSNVLIATVNDDYYIAVGKLFAESYRRQQSKGFSMANCHEFLLSYASMANIEALFSCAPPAVSITHYTDFTTNQVWSLLIDGMGRYEEGEGFVASNEHDGHYRSYIQFDFQQNLRLLSIRVNCRFTFGTLYFRTSSGIHHSYTTPFDGSYEWNGDGFPEFSIFQIHLNRCANGDVIRDVSIIAEVV
jgi:hypothetical protein